MAAQYLCGQFPRFEYCVPSAPSMLPHLQVVSQSVQRRWLLTADTIGATGPSPLLKWMNVDYSSPHPRIQPWSSRHNSALQTDTIIASELSSGLSADAQPLRGDRHTPLATGIEVAIGRERKITRGQKHRKRAAALRRRETDQSEPRAERAVTRRPENL